ncbi:type II toxin-antitoxin system HicA family toxin [Desulfococcus sp.]|jgi:predicted RNA binding protein YcfA (HicA-like mRNA interferase family)|uniref:type II toxin-antitoxin system HicA family toxin n=1 Tax=Desulfococcus sp. TaxID=2025834 RepID=UPI003594803E
MAKLPVDAPVESVINALTIFGFRMLREGSHISMARENADGMRTPLTIPNHRRIKRSTLQTILTQTRIPREVFLKADDAV